MTREELRIATTPSVYDRGPSIWDLSQEDLHRLVAAKGVHWVRARLLDEFHNRDRG